VSPSHSFALPPANAPRREAEIPSGLAITPDGNRLYVCGNLSNRLLEIDTATGKTLRTFDVGVAPYDVVLVGERAYVSNWAAII
jgi:YVTN family beta-propeller protein